MRRFVDLHTHSTASDGDLPPAEVIRLAEREGLAAIALTDHDTTAGLAEASRAAEAFVDLHFVPGIEISARPPSGTLHILGLGIDEASPAIQGVAAFLRNARTERTPRILDRLHSLGAAVEMPEVLREAGGEVVSRVHIARALVAKGHVGDLREAFGRYLAKGAPAYVERDRPAPGEAIAAVVEAGGVAALAHPVQLECETPERLEQIVRDLKAAGLGAIEAYHSDQTPEYTRVCIDLAREVGLGVTGGSDFHGRAKAAVRMGRPRVALTALGDELAGGLLR